MAQFWRTRLSVVSVPHARRVLGSFTYHLRRLLGIPRDEGKIALLGDENHTVTRSWRVQGLAGPRNQRPAFDLPKLGSLDSLDVEILPYQDHPLDSWISALQESSGATQPKWFLLAKGHSREVKSIEAHQPPYSAECSLHITLHLGDERQASPSGKNVFTAEAVGNLHSAFADMPKAVYSELGSQIRALTDIRFKLLTIVPTVSGLVLTVLLTAPARDRSPLSIFLASILGFGITVGIRIYDVRNSQLYDDLISRARSLEASLGIERGPYTRRGKTIWPFEHDFALSIVYTLVLIAWLLGAVFSLWART